MHTCTNIRQALFRLLLDYLKEICLNNARNEGTGNRTPICQSCVCVCGRRKHGSGLQESPRSPRGIRRVPEISSYSKVEGVSARTGRKWSTPVERPARHTQVALENRSSPSLTTCYGSDPDDLILNSQHFGRLAWPLDVEYALDSHKELPLSNLV